MTICHNCLGVWSMAKALGQEPVHVPHWMQAWIISLTDATVWAAVGLIFPSGFLVYSRTAVIRSNTASTAPSIRRAESVGSTDASLGQTAAQAPHP